MAAQSAAPQWLYDPQRRQYYWIRPTDGVLLYQDGRQVAPPRNAPKQQPQKPFQSSTSSCVPADGYRPTSASFSYSGPQFVSPSAAVATQYPQVGAQQYIGPPYRHMRCLLVYWQEETYFRKEQERLRNVFISRLGIHAELFGIPRRHQNATRDVSARLKGFKQASDDHNDLLIVVYGGHGVVVPPPGEKSNTRKLQWTTDRGDQFVEWNELQEDVLFPGDKDTLLILDCCYAGAADRSLNTARKDLLAAAPWNRKTPKMAQKEEEGELSFTKRIIKAILSFSEPFSIKDLQLAVIRQLPTEKPIYHWRPNKPTHEIMLTPKPRSNPIDMASLSLSDRRAVPGGRNGRADSPQDEDENESSDRDSTSTSQSTQGHLGFPAQNMQHAKEAQKLVATIRTLMQQGNSQKQTFDIMLKRYIDAGYSPESAAAWIRSLVAHGRIAPSGPASQAINGARKTAKPNREDGAEEDSEDDNDEDDEEDDEEDDNEDD